MKHYATLDGRFSHSSDTPPNVPDDFIEVPSRPSSSMGEVWNGSAWDAPLNEIKAECLAAVDIAAAKLDAKYLTVGGMQSAVYRIKEEQARTYKAANYPALADPLASTDPAFLGYGHVRQYRETLRLTNPAATDQTAADAIIAQADQMVRLSIARERRLTFKQQIRDATTAAQAQGARDAALAELGAL